MSIKDITIVITSFKSEKKIKKCLNSIDKECKVINIENSNNLKLYVCSYKTGNIKLKSNDDLIILRQKTPKCYSQNLEVKNNIEIGELTNNFTKKDSIMYRFNITSPDNIKKTVESADSNAENNFQYDIDNLYVKEAYVGKSIVLKRFRPRAKGRASAIKKPYSNVTIILSEKAKQKKELHGTKS